MSVNRFKFKQSIWWQTYYMLHSRHTDLLVRADLQTVEANPHALVVDLQQNHKLW